MPSERSRMTNGTDRRRRDAATARPEGPAPMIIGPSATETFGVGLVEGAVVVVVAIEKILL